MGSFLAWFGGSQALDRIIKLERMGVPDDKILMEINYMVRKVEVLKKTLLHCYFESGCFLLQETSRQKQNAMRLGAEFVSKVDEDMAEIMEGITYIHSWIRNQALFRTSLKVSFK